MFGVCFQSECISSKQSSINNALTQGAFSHFVFKMNFLTITYHYYYLFLLSVRYPIKLDHFNFVGAFLSQFSFANMNGVLGPVYYSKFVASV